MESSKASPILALVVVSILGLGAVALWDEERESSAALADFATEQSKIARAAASVLAARLRSLDGAALDAALVAQSVRPIEESDAVVVFIERPGDTRLVSTSEKTVLSPSIERALAAGVPWVRLSRDEAAQLGLPARTAMAGLATAEAGATGQWKVAVVATALRERDREVRAEWRLALGFSLASALIATFGGFAVRMQRKEIRLARDLAVADAMQVRDERLVRADKLATLGALATGIAHEVSTPLGVIVGRAEQLLPRVAADERAKRCVDAITEQAERISQVIRAFLRLARGGAPSLERVDPSTLARAALELVEHRFAKAEVHLTRHGADDLPRVACDPKLFEQVLINLLLNACDACAAGGNVELTLMGDRERVAFVVTDDGSGITPAAAQRATEPFFTTKPEGQGTGLGLAIANEIVKHHRGQLTISARENARGTRAAVELTAVQEIDHV